MNKMKCVFAVAGLSLFLCAATQAREEKVVQFTTLPQVIRTTVFHHYNIVSPEKVTRVVEYPDNIYQITVLTDSGEQIVYVNAEGTIVERPSAVVGETEQGGSAEVTVTMDEIQSGGDRYEFVQDQGPDAIYIDHQTNKRVIVKSGAGKGNQGSVRTKEENQSNVRTNEKSKGEIRTNENEGAPAGQEKTDQGTGNQGEKGMNQEQKTQKQGAGSEQQEQGNRGAIGNGQQEQNRDTSGNPRAEEKNGAGDRNMNDKTQEKNATEQRNPNAKAQEKTPAQQNMNENQGQKEKQEMNRTPGEQHEQQSQEKTKEKGKASPTP
jgi:hypothetical protein